MEKTYLDKLMDIISPDYCYFCGKIGDIACPGCLNKQNNKGYSVETSAKSGILREIFVSDRDGVLRKIVDDYKFMNMKRNYRLLAVIFSRVLLENIPFSSRDKIILVPIPTAKNHIRERGFDHIDLLVDEISKITGIRVEKVLQRSAGGRQRGASAKKRAEQAARAFKTNIELDPKKIYLLVDDIKTTGSTLNEAAKVLQKAGAKKIWVSYILKQK